MTCNQTRVVTAGKDVLESALSGEWEVISGGPYAGCLCRLINTDQGWRWVVAKLTRLKLGKETELRIIAALKSPPEAH